MKVAIIDLGTNTFNLLIAEVTSKSINRIYKNKIAVKIGDGGFEDNRITDDSLLRAKESLRELAHELRQFDPEHVFAYGTSALRNASNNKEVLEILHKHSGIDVELISGNEEAEMIYKGVKFSNILDKRRSLLMDIGGGSTEFIICDKSTIYYRESFDLGVSRLKERFEPSNPIEENEISDIKNYLESELTTLTSAINEFSPEVMIGSSGSFNSFVDMLTSEDELRSTGNYNFNLTDLVDLNSRLIKTTTQERLEINGLVKMRVDTIILASILTNFVIKKYNFTVVKRCPYALKEGALIWFLEKS